jgi:hypothetical protein
MDRDGDHVKPQRFSESTKAAHGIPVASRLYVSSEIEDYGPPRRTLPLGREIDHDTENSKCSPPFFAWIVTSAVAWAIIGFLIWFVV